MGGKTETPEIDDQLIYNIWVENIQWEKESLFGEWCWEMGQPRDKEGSWTPVWHHTQKSTPVD